MKTYKMSIRRPTTAIRTIVHLAQRQQYDGGLLYVTACGAVVEEEQALVYFTVDQIVNCHLCLSKGWPEDKS